MWRAGPLFTQERTENRCRTKRTKPSEKADSVSAEREDGALRLRAIGLSTHGEFHRYAITAEDQPKQAAGRGFPARGPGRLH